MSILTNPRATFLASAAIAAAGVLLALPATGQQGQSGKKLYCWDEGGRRVCSDALPASAVDRPRTEINETSGMATKRVERALTAEEQVKRAQQLQAAEAEARQQQREMAMVVSYSTEADLERAFRNRFELLDESIKASDLALSNLRQSLLTLLRQANELELQAQPVGRRLVEKIKTQHNELNALVAMQGRQRAERIDLDNQYKQALARYRELKAAPHSAATAPPATPGG